MRPHGLNGALGRVDPNPRDKVSCHLAHGLPISGCRLTSKHRSWRFDAVQGLREVPSYSGRVAVSFDAQIIKIDDARSTPLHSDRASAKASSQARCRSRIRSPHLRSSTRKVPVFIPSLSTVRRSPGASLIVRLASADEPHATRDARHAVRCGGRRRIPTNANPRRRYRDVDPA